MADSFPLPDEPQEPAETAPLPPEDLPVTSVEIASEPTREEEGSLTEESEAAPTNPEAQSEPTVTGVEENAGEPVEGGPIEETQPEPPPATEPQAAPTSSASKTRPLTNIRANQPLSPEDERTWAMVAHLSVLANLVTGFLGPVVALIIYLAYKDRSRYVAYQSMQSFVFQLIWWVGGVAMIGVLWAVTGLLSAVIIGLLCIPFAILATIVIGVMPLVALVYGVVGAIQTSQGQDFRYWLVGDWVRSSWTSH